MADYVLSAKGTYDGSNFDSGIEQSQAKLQGFMEEARSVGKSIKSAIGDGIVQAADAITSSIGTIGAGITALAMTGGIKRALNMEQAEHLFDGIGLGWQSVTDAVDEATGQFKTYKQIVNDAVTDTQFSLDEAAVVAAQLGAAGLTSGTEMAQALDACTGIASTFGVELADVGGIFQKVAAQGKVTGDNIYQMSSRGINALSALADHYGVTQEEAQKMVSAGEVDFQNFSDAMTEAFGGKAKTANDTFVGSLANVKAALSRIGAKFATPGLDALKNVFNALRPLINAVSAALDPLVEKFTNFLGIAEDGSVEVGGAVDRLIGFITELTDKVKSLGEGGFENLSTGAKAAAAAIGILSLGSMGGLISQIPIVGSALGGLFGMLGKLATPVGTLTSSMGGLSGIFAGISAPVLALVAAIGVLVAAFVTLMATDEDFRNTITDLVGEIGSALMPAFESVASLLPSIQALFQAVMDAVRQLAPAFLELVAAIAPVVSTIVSAVVPVIETLMGIISELVAQVTGFVVPIIEMVTETVSAHMPQIQSIIESAMNAINTLIQTVWPYIRDIITNAMAAIQAVIQTVWPIIEAVITAAMNVIQAVIDTVTAIIEGDWDAVWNGILSIASAIWEGIKNVVQTAITAVQDNIGNVLSAIQGLWNSIWSAISAFASSVWNTIVSIVSGAAGAIMGAVSGLVSSVAGFFSSLWSSVTSTVSSMWSSAVSAFSSGVSSVVSTVSQLPGQIANIFSGAASWLIDSGRSIIQGLIDGIRQGFADAASVVSDGLAGLRDLFPFSPAKKGPFSGKGWVLYSGMSIMDALAEGADKRVKNTVQAFSGVADKVRDALDIGSATYGYEINTSSLAELPVSAYGNKSANVSDSAMEALLGYLYSEVVDLNSSLGRKIADNAPVVTETERQAARRYRRAQYA